MHRIPASSTFDRGTVGDVTIGAMALIMAQLA
jgi:hypothetical protein